MTEVYRTQNGRQSASGVLCSSAAAPAEHNSQVLDLVHLGLAEHGPLGSDGDIGRQRVPGPADEALAVDRGDDGLFQGQEMPLLVGRGRVVPPPVPQDLRARLEVALLGEVVARREVAPSVPAKMIARTESSCSARSSAA